MKISRVGKAGFSSITKKGTTVSSTKGTVGVAKVNTEKGTIRSSAIGSHNGPWRSKPIQRVKLETDSGSKFTHTSLNRKHTVAAGVAAGGAGAYSQRGNRAENKHPVTRGYKRVK